MGDKPSGLAGLSPNEPDKWGSVSGRCGSWFFSAGYLPAPAGGGASWRVVDNGEVWIACGLAAEAPDFWRFQDGRESPTGFDVWDG